MNKLEAIAALMGVGVRRGGLQLGPAAASGVPQGVGREPRRVEGPAAARRGLARGGCLPHLRLLRIHAALASPDQETGHEVGGLSADEAGW